MKGEERREGEGRQKLMIEKQVRRDKGRRENGRKIMFTHLPILATNFNFC